MKFCLLTLNMLRTPFSCVSIVDLEQVNVRWEETFSHTQQTITCSKSTIETVEKGVKYVY